MNMGVELNVLFKENLYVCRLFILKIDSLKIEKFGHHTYLDPSWWNRSTDIFGRLSRTIWNEEFFKNMQSSVTDSLYHYTDI